MAKNKNSEQGLLTIIHTLHSNHGIDLIHIGNDGKDIIIRIKEYPRKDIKNALLNLAKPLDFIEQRISLSRIGHQR